MFLFFFQSTPRSPRPNQPGGEINSQRPYIYPTQPLSLLIHKLTMHTSTLALLTTTLFALTTSAQSDQLTCSSIGKGWTDCGTIEVIPTTNNGGTFDDEGSFDLTPDIDLGGDDGLDDFLEDLEDQQDDLGEIGKRSAVDAVGRSLVAGLTLGKRGGLPLMKRVTSSFCCKYSLSLSLSPASSGCGREDRICGGPRAV